MLLECYSVRVQYIACGLLECYFVRVVIMLFCSYCSGLFVLGESCKSLIYNIVR